MILNASQRGGASDLGRHLLKAENEHVEVHEVRGFVSNTIMGAMKEAQAVAAGTKCKQHLFSVSLSPPETASVPIATFEDAIERIEKAHGLEGQPRMIVFHEKEGRRHAHAVWSRIDAETMTAKPLPFFKLKLREISKQLYLENDWRMPTGLMDSKARDPRNFDLAQWQQAKREGRDPRQLNGLVQECWAASDDRASFSRSLEERGLYLAKGDRRGHVVVTYEGEVHSLARMVGKKTKEVVVRLGSPDDLRSVQDTRHHIAMTIAPKLRGMMLAANQIRDRDMATFHQKRKDMKEKHVDERCKLYEGQRHRHETDAQARAKRLRTGIKGLLDRLTGDHRRIKGQNEREALQALERDRKQRDTLIAAQLRDRQELQKHIRYVRHRHAAKLLELHRDLTNQRDNQAEASNSPSSMRDAFIRSAENAQRPAPERKISRQSNRTPFRGRDKGLGL